MPNYQAILRMFQELQDKANEANEQRYQDILEQLGITQGQVGGTYDEVFELLGTMGDAERQRIGSQASRAGAQSTQSLISRGLGSTTIQDSMQRRIDEEENRSNLALEEAISGQKAGALMGRAGSEERMGSLIASMMEMRTDQGPDLSMLMQLMGQSGAGQGAYGSAMAGGGGSGGGDSGSSFGASSGGGSTYGTRSNRVTSSGPSGSSRAGSGLEVGSALASFFGPGSQGFFGGMGSQPGWVSSSQARPDDLGDYEEGGGGGGEGGGKKSRTAAETAWRRTAKPYGMSMDEWMKDW